MSDQLHLSLVQTHLAWENAAANQLHLETLLHNSPPRDLVILPEMWPTGFTMNTSLAESPDGSSVTWMKNMAAKYHIHLAGSIPIVDHQQYYNRFYCIDSQQIVATYDKRHLFSYGKEHNHYTAGTQHAPFAIQGWRIQPVICYDLRFPVWCRNTIGYDVLLVVANWPKARIHHWDALLQARAIENQCYVVAVNRIGTDGNGLEYPGHSSVYDMNGTQLLSLHEEQEGVFDISLDTSRLQSFRNQYRFLDDQDTFTL